MFLLLLLGLAIGPAFSQELYSSERFEEYFEEFIVQYNRTYTLEEKKLRFEIFKDNLIEINTKYRQLGKTSMGITQFSDYSKEEFQRLLGHKADTSADSACQPMSVEDMSKIKSPDSFDWRDKNVISPVKYQGSCGSCYAFSTTGNIESQYAIKHNQFVLVSEQQIVDCTGQLLCQGGFPTTSLTMLIQEGGSESEDSYPYEAANGTCRFDPSKIAIKVTGCNAVTVTDENQFQDLIYNNGPLSLGLHGDNLHQYSGGIYTASECGTGKIDHAVLLIGYGTENGQPYWILKNSWGTGWGEQGFFRLSRGENTCQLVNGEPAAVAVVA